MSTPVAITQEVTPLASTTATLQGKISDDGGLTCEARFMYRKIHEISAQDTGTLSDITRIHGLVYYNNYFYGVTRTDPGEVVKIDASDLTSYSTLTPQHNSTDAGDLMEIIEAGGYLWTVDDNDWLYKIDPSAFTVSASTELSIGVASADGSLCADATYIYIGGTGDIAKVTISDLTKLEETIDVAKYFHSIAQYGDYVFAHSYTTKTLYKVLKSDLSLDSTSDAWTNQCSDDIAIDDTYVYLANEYGSGGVVRVAQSDLAISELATSISMGLSYGVYKVNDGSNDRLLVLDYENNYIWVLSMPDCSLVGGGYLLGLESVDPINELASDGSYIYLCQWVTSGNAPIASFPQSDVVRLSWTETDWQNTLETDDTFYDELTGLTTETEYEFQAQARNDEGEGDWSSLGYFDTEESLPEESLRDFNDAAGRLIKGQSNFPYAFPFSFYVNVTGRTIQSGTGMRVLGSVTGRLVIGRNNFPYRFPFSFYTNVTGRTIESP